MRILYVNAIVKKNGQNFKRVTKSFSTNEPFNVGYVKDLIKSDLGFPFEVVKEEFYYMDEKLEDTDNVPFKSGNEFILTIK